MTRRAPAGPPAQAVAAAFAQALELASARIGATAPNPPVGCVLLDADGAVLAAAAHQAAGQSHAEALAIARSRANGTADRIHTIAVTLEPCTHTGRTPPCTEAVLTTPARQIWIGAPDPNPKAAGGAQMLASAGLSVRTIAGLDAPAAKSLSADAERLIAPFAKRARAGVPWIIVKQALDRNGSMVPPPGQTTFTSEASLTLAHRLRREADAILTGSGTVLADDPAFTVRRVPDFPERRRQLVIMDRRGRVPARYIEAARARGFDVRIATDLPQVLDWLGGAGCLQVLVEAGITLTAAILDQALWDEHVLIRQNADGASDTVTMRRRTASGIVETTSAVSTR